MRVYRYWVRSKLWKLEKNLYRVDDAIFALLTARRIRCRSHIPSDTADTSANCINYVCGLDLCRLVSRKYRVWCSPRRQWYSRGCEARPGQTFDESQGGMNSLCGRKGDVAPGGYRFTSLRIRFAAGIIEINRRPCWSLLLRRNGFSIGGGRKSGGKTPGRRGRLCSCKKNCVAMDRKIKCFYLWMSCTTFDSRCWIDRLLFTFFSSTSASGRWLSYLILFSSCWRGLACE